MAVLHSHQSDVERHEHWRRIARGEVEVVVGARSAIFAPTPHLGLIVLDEEHESTFKQESAPRYHARDVALQRAADQNVPLVLGQRDAVARKLAAGGGGASFSWSRCRGGCSIGRCRPCGPIDLRDEAHSKLSRGAISRPLHRAMDDGPARRRAGDFAAQSPRLFHAHPVPRLAATSMKCPHCDLPLTFHRHA